MTDTITCIISQWRTFLLIASFIRMSAFLKTQWFNSTASESTLADTPHKRMPHRFFFLKPFSNTRFWFPISCCSICRGVSGASHVSGNGWYKSWICGDKIKARRRHPHLWTHWFPTAVVESFLPHSLNLSPFTPHFQCPLFYEIEISLIWFNSFGCSS